MGSQRPPACAKSGADRRLTPPETNSSWPMPRPKVPTMFMKEKFCTWLDLASQMPSAHVHRNLPVGFGNICGQCRCLVPLLCFIQHITLEVCSNGCTLFVSDTCSSVDCDALNAIQQCSVLDNAPGLVFSCRSQTKLPRDSGISTLLTQ